MQDQYAMQSQLSPERIKQDVKDDLKKTPEELLCDVHAELQNDGRTKEENMLHAQKRLAAMTVKQWQENQRLSRWMLRLTVIATLLALASVGIAAWQVFGPGCH